jgi:hypothetical protein
LRHEQFDVIPSATWVVTLYKNKANGLSNSKEKIIDEYKKRAQTQLILRPFFELFACLFLHFINISFVLDCVVFSTITSFLYGQW